MIKNRKLTYPVIAAAADGDVDAINTVLKQYEGYIAKLSTKRLYDESGKVYEIIDEELRRHLETKLILKVLKFKAA